MRASFFALTLVAASLGCSSSPAPTRTVTGQLRSTNATVTAQSADHQQFASSMTSGRFTLQLPTGASYELLVGNAQISWPTAKGPARWAKLGEGPTLDLGHVSRQSDGHYACDHQGSDDDHCDRDDDEDGGDTDDHDDDGYGGYGGYGGGEHHGCDGGASSNGGGTGTGGGGAGGGGGSTGTGGIP